MKYEPYRPCPMCRATLTFKMKYKENGIDWDVYECRSCGTEVWVDPYKRMKDWQKR